jgi:hypothetical protein
MTKEFLYVGHYISTEGKYVLKIGTTNNLDRRQKEHSRKYKETLKKGNVHRMKKDTEFEYDWWIPLSKYNTIRYEDRNRNKWIEEGIGEYVLNDRFVLDEKPDFVEITIRKKYIVAL